MIPNIPKIIAAIGIIHPNIEIIGNILDMRGIRLHKSRTMETALSAKPRTPKIKAKIPNTFPMLITKTRLDNLNSLVLLIRIII